MTEAASDHTDSQHNVDDVFQLLVHARGVLPDTKAKGEILSALQRGALQVDFHIRGGARSVRARKPTPEEECQFATLSAALHEQKASEQEMREAMDRATAVLYEHAPPQGLTERVHRESWEPGRVFSLTIEEGRLNVLPNRALDYPWDAYSFTIANWSLVNELWPPKPPQPSSEPITNLRPSSESATKPPRPGSAGAWIDELCPDGAWRNSTAKRIHDLVEQEIENRNTEIEQEAKKQNRKPPPAMKCPGLRAFQIALSKRRQQNQQS
jgi:hypothetical protein